MDCERRAAPRRLARRGATMILAMVLLVALLGMTAFAVDVGYTVCTRSQLQNAADAAALAGAAQLPGPLVQYSTPGQSGATQRTILNNAIANARMQAQQMAALNGAGQATSLVLNNADVVCGSADAGGNFSPYQAGDPFPNSVQVTLRLDSQANGSLRLFFAGLLGQPTVSVLATAQASAISNVNDFSDTKSVNGKLLPVAMDVRLWQRFLRDGTSASAGGQVTNGPNGLPQLQVYPDSSAFGGFGLVSIGPPASDVPSYRAWINNGPSATDLSYLKTHQQLPVSPGSPSTWSAGPGMKSTLQSDFAAIVGQPRLIPLYDGSLASSGGYPIVGFAGVVITEADGRGSNMNISVQPAAVIDPTGLGGVTAGTSMPTFSFTHVRLTR